MVNQQRQPICGASWWWQWLPIMLLLAISQTTGATPPSNDDWWQRTVFYQIYPRSFMDSNGDGVGDLRGITSRLEHLKDAGIGATWLSPIFRSPMVDFGYDIADYTAIQPEYGTMEDFEALLAEAKRLGIKIILDFVPNHTSDQCEWFRRSVAREHPYTDYYVWQDGRVDPNGNGTARLPPNNWQSVFYGSAWTLHPDRGQYYLHQFTAQQPDLNFRNPAVVDEMREVLRFWLRKGVAGFRIDAVNHLFEADGFPDEPETGTDRDPLSYGFTHHIYTKDLLEDYDMVYQWRALLDDWSREHGGDARIIMTEAYANITFTMKYYHAEEDDGDQPDGQPRAAAGSHMPFNFLLITDLNRDSSAQDFVYTIQKWLTYMPRVGATANWVLGNHDQPRVGTRYGAERIDAIHTLLLTLPGIAVTYYGEEIGMVDNPDAISSGGGDSVTGASDAFIVFSRDPERTPFQWDGTANAGFSSGPTTWLPVHPNYRELNLAAQRLAERSHYKTYQALVALRAHETFRKGSIQLVPYSSNVVVYVRELAEADTFVVVINLVAGERTVDLVAVFPKLSAELTVASSGSASNYRVGDIVQADKLIVGGYDGLVLRSVPLMSRAQRNLDGERHPTATSVWSAVKDAAVIASIIIALGSSYYGLRAPWQSVASGLAEGSLKK
uniref:alpha-glucosidase n=1 Tax=Anopheles gambiae TaxID=7165 RepID=A0A1S4GZS2_ANOGA